GCSSNSACARCMSGRRASVGCALLLNMRQLPQGTIPTMQALQIDRHGPVSALTVRDVPRPALRPQEVLIEIHAAALNPSDVASAEGRFDHARLPRILGRDFAGRVCEGPADLLGQEVWGSGG